MFYRSIDITLAQYLLHWFVLSASYQSVEIEIVNSQFFGQWYIFFVFLVLWFRLALCEVLAYVFFVFFTYKNGTRSVRWLWFCLCRFICVCVVSWLCAFMVDIWWLCRSVFVPFCVCVGSCLSCGVIIAGSHLLLYAVVRRVVAVGVDPASTAVREVMTPNPTSVRSDDSAMEALGIMIERHFRHLPVRTKSCSFCAVLRTCLIFRRPKYRTLGFCGGLPI